MSEFDANTWASLKPCPWCGKIDKLELVGAENAWKIYPTRDGGWDDKHIWCDRCLVHGPERRTVRGACNAWNRRADV